MKSKDGHSCTDCPPGYKRIFCSYIRRRDGRIVYPKNGRFFTFCVKDE